jgi:hypothetical protein
MQSGASRYPVSIHPVKFEPVEDERPDPLTTAANVALQTLGPWGFRLQDALATGRGSTVVLASDTVALELSADWLEGYLYATVRASGTAPLPVEKLIPTVRFALRRLPRRTTRGVLEGRIQLIVNSIEAHAPELLRGGDEALDLVLRDGPGRGVARTPSG